MSSPRDQESNSKPVDPPEAGSTPAEHWTEHEHVAEPVQVQAQKLLDQTGSPELAKHAVDSAAQDHPHAVDGIDAFAKRWGFSSVRMLCKASILASIVPGRVWCVTQVGPHAWILWNSVDLGGDCVYPSRTDAERHIPVE